MKTSTLLKIAVVSLLCAGCRPQGRPGAPAGPIAGDRPVDALVTPGPDSPLFGEGRFTPLHLAAARGDAAAIRNLVARGADVNADSVPDGLEPLYYAAAGGHIDAVKLLADAGCDPRRGTLG